MERAQPDLIVVFKWIGYICQKTLAIEECPVYRSQIEQVRLPLKAHNCDVAAGDAFFTCAINNEIYIRDEVAALV